MANNRDRGEIQSDSGSGTSQPPLGGSNIDFGQDTGAVNPPADSSKTRGWFSKVEDLEDEVEVTQNQLEATRRRRQIHEEKISEVMGSIEGLKSRLSSLENANKNQDIQDTVIREVNKRIVAPLILWLSTALILAGGIGAYYGSIVVPLLTSPIAASGLYYLWRSRDER